MLLNNRRFVALITKVKVIHSLKVKHRFLKVTLYMTLVCKECDISTIYNYREIFGREMESSAFKNKKWLSNWNS